MWEDRAKVEANLEYISSLRRTIITELASRMNKLHNTDLSTQSWHLILGYWLQQFITVTYDRWSSLSNTRRDFPFNLSLSSTNELKIIPQDLEHATALFISKSWNHDYSCVLDILLNKKELPALGLLPIDEGTSHFTLPNSDCVKKLTYAVIFRAINVLFNLFFSSSSSYSILIHDLYVPFIRLIQLRFLLPSGAFVFFSGKRLTNLETDNTLRSWRLDSLCSQSEFEQLLQILIPALMPASYLETFSSRNGFLITANSRKSPKIVFTSIGHFSDDAFNKEAALHLTRGAQLVIYTHGGCLNRFNGGYEYESDIADLLLVAGTHANRGYSPYYNVGYLHNKLSFAQWDARGPAIVVTVALPKQLYDIRSMPIGSQIEDYYDDLFAFYNLLQPDVCNKTVIRLYPSDFDSDMKARWRIKYPQVHIDDARKPIANALNKCRLAIITYNFTAYLETLSANIPTVIYWNPEHWEIPNLALADFEMLRTFGIFHDSYLSAADHVNSIWEHIEAWWSNTELQLFRSKFCTKYCHYVNSKPTRLAHALHMSANGIFSVDSDEH